MRTLFVETKTLNIAINTIIALLLYIALSNSDITWESSTNQLMGLVLASIYFVSVVLTKFFIAFDDIFDDTFGSVVGAHIMCCLAFISLGHLFLGIGFIGVTLAVVLYAFGNYMSRNLQFQQIQIG